MPPVYNFDLVWVEVDAYPGAKRTWVLRYRDGRWPDHIEDDEFFSDDP